MGAAKAAQEDLRAAVEASLVRASHASTEPPARFGLSMLHGPSICPPRLDFDGLSITAASHEAPFGARRRCAPQRKLSLSTRSCNNE